MWVGVCSGIGLEGWLRWFTHPFGGIVCRGHVQYPAFPPDSLEVAIGFLVFAGHACMFLSCTVSLCPGTQGDVCAGASTATMGPVYSTIPGHLVVSS